jgi:hypothetical protein
MDKKMKTYLITFIIFAFSGAINASELCEDSIGNTLSNFAESKVYQCEDVCLVVGKAVENEDRELVFLHAFDESSNISQYKIDHYYSRKERTGNLMKGYSYIKVELNDDLSFLNLDDYTGKNRFMGKPKMRTRIVLDNSTLSIQRKVGNKVLVSENLDCSLL